MTTTEKLLRELIALPSVNPAFLTARHPHAGERRVSEFLAATAGKAGLDIEFESVLPGRANLLARLSPPGKARQRILLAPHMDTVNAAPEQFTPRTQNGRLFGRGACDTKGSVAAMLQALCALAKSGARPKETEIVFAGLIDEENAQAGSRALAASGFRADLAIVGEATRLQVVTAHKGSLWVRIEAHGRAAHGSKPQEGRNAILAVARMVEALETDYAAMLRKRRHPLLGSATVSVGTIRGGTQPNIVPDYCEIQIDRRTLPGETESGVERELLSFLRKRGLQASLGHDKLAPCLPMETDHKIPLVAQFLRSARQRKPAGAVYFCDAAVLSEGGIPSVVFGPGDIAQGHTTDEWVSLSSLNKAYNMLLNFLRGLS